MVKFQATRYLCSHHNTINKYRINRQYIKNKLIKIERDSLPSNSRRIILNPILRLHAMTDSKTIVHSALTELLVNNKLHLKSDELVVSTIQDLIKEHGVDVVREWRDQTKKHKHAILHILVNFNKQFALESLVPVLDQINVPRASDQCTPLHLSIWKRNLTLSSLLIDLGADSSLKNSYGEDCEKVKKEVAQQNNIVFIDLELTALPSDSSSSILEVAVVITDMHLSEVSQQSWVVQKTEEELAKLSSWHQDHFRSIETGGNGLFDECMKNNSAMPIKDVAENVLDFVKKHCPESTCSLAGFSVHGDREILKKEIPALYSYMSHQIIDVSTIMNLSGKWKPDVMIGRPEQQGGSHRAMSDVIYSIETLKFFKKNLWGM